MGVDEINQQIKSLKGIEETNQISDGFHTFDELYAHRVTLYLVLCRLMADRGHTVWRSRKHSDGNEIPGFFVLGIFDKAGTQISYHIGEEDWSKADFAETLDLAPEYDGHNSEDVIHRLRNILIS